MPFACGFIDCSAAARWACFCLRFCFFRFTDGAAPLMSAGRVGTWPFGFVAIWAMAGDVSDESLVLKALGTVMNFEPSLFVYFACGL